MHTLHQHLHFRSQDMQCTDDCILTLLHKVEALHSSPQGQYGCCISALGVDIMMQGHRNTASPLQGTTGKTLPQPFKRQPGLTICSQVSSYKLQIRLAYPVVAKNVRMVATNSVILAFDRQIHVNSGIPYGRPSKYANNRYTYRVVTANPPRGPLLLTAWKSAPRTSSV